MTRAILAAVIALLSSSAISIASSGEISRAERVLWDKNGNFGYSVVSQNFSETSRYNSMSAGIFLIPRNTDWMVKKVVVTGMYLKGAGPASSEIVTFYKNGADVPGSVLGQYTINCTEHGGNFVCKLPQGQRLRNKLGGDKVFWVSFVVNCQRRSCGEWGWVQNTTTSDVWGSWRNPADGFGTGCVVWTAIDYCWGSDYGYGFAFELIGSSRSMQR